MNLTDRQPYPAPRRRKTLLLSPFLLTVGLMGNVFTAVAQTSTTAEPALSATGPIRLRQPAQADPTPSSEVAGNRQQMAPVAAATALSDFEAYVRKQPGGGDVRRLGVALIEGLQPSSDTADYNPLVPPDYLLRAGDELVLTLWGSVDADLRLQVDRSGRISIPRVGPVMVSGVRYADLPEVISRRIGLVFKNFQLSVSLGQLRGLLRWR